MPTCILDPAGHVAISWTARTDAPASPRPPLVLVGPPPRPTLDPFPALGAAPRPTPEMPDRLPAPDFFVRRTRAPAVGMALMACVRFDIKPMLRMTLRNPPAPRMRALPLPDLPITPAISWPW